MQDTGTCRKGNDAADPEVCVDAAILFSDSLLRWRPWDAPGISDKKAGPW